MIRRPPRSTRTDTLLPYTTLFRSHISADEHFLRRIDAAAAERGITRSAFLMEAAHRLMRPSPAPKADLARPVELLNATSRRPAAAITGVLARQRRAEPHTDPSSLYDRPDKPPVGTECISL